MSPARPGGPGNGHRGSASFCEVGAGPLLKTAATKERSAVSGTTTVEDLIEATAQAREVIRQAHEVVKDLRSAIAEARRMQPELMRDWEGKARNVVQELFMDQLPLFVESATKSLVDALGLMATCLKCGQVWGCVEKDSN